MAQSSDAVWLPVLPSMKGFGPALIKGAGKEVDTAGTVTGKRYGKALAAGVAVASGAAVATGKFLYNVGETFDAMTDTIRAGTGATGKDLEGLIGVAKNVGRDVPAEFDKIGTTVADLNTRLGLSGEVLDVVARQYLEAGRILGEEIDVNQTAAAFKAFHIEAEKIPDAMDTLFRASQATGVGMNELAAGVQKAGPALTNLGFTFADSVALMGSLDKAGLNSQQVAASLTRSLTSLAKSGEEPADAFQRIIDEMQGYIDAGDTAKALELSSTIFGTRGASQFVSAIQSGVLELDNLTAAAGVSEDSILGVANETMDFSEQWQKFKNHVLLLIEPIASSLFETMGNGMRVFTEDLLPQFTAGWKGEDGPEGVFRTLGTTVRGVTEFFNDHKSTIFTVAGALVALKAAMVGVNAVLKVQNALSKVGNVLLVAKRGILLAWKGAMLVVRGVTVAWTVAQKALNVVLNLNPIGLVVLAITGLVAALTLAWRNSETFRDIVTGAWEAVKTGISAAWDWIKGVFQSMQDGVENVRQWFADKLAAVSNAFASMRDSLTSAWTTVKTNVLDAFQSAIDSVRSAFQTAVDKISGVWTSFKDTAISVWTALKTGVFWAFTATINGLKNLFTNAIRGMQVIWLGLKTVFLAAWNTIKTGVFGAFSLAVGGVRSFFERQVNGMKRIWGGLKTAFKAVWDWISSKVFSPFRTGLDNLSNWVKSTKNNISNLWGGVKGAFAKPINWVIDTVWNGGIKKVFDSVVDAVGLGKSKHLPAARRIPGYAKGGTHPGGPAVVGEEGPELIWTSRSAYVSTARQTAKLLAAGRDLPNNLAVKAAGRTPSEALAPMGGIWDGISSGAKWVWDRTGGKVVKWVRGGLAKAAGAVLAPLQTVIRNTVGKWGHTGGLISGFTGKSIEYLKAWIRGQDEQSVATGDIHSGPPPGTGKWRRPSRGPITSRYGPRWGRLHAGIDIAGGGPTYAAADGTVFRTGSGILGGRTGLGIGISHGGGVFTYYGHNPVGGIRVRPGQQVKAGQHIGYQGATGNVTGVHLHFELHRGGWGRAVNPQSLGVFDSGGWLHPGKYAVNTSSRPEPVFSAAQWEVLRQNVGRGQLPRQVTLQVGDREFPAYVKELADDQVRQRVTDLRQSRRQLVGG